MKPQEAPVWECPVKRELRVVRERQQAAQDKGGCSAMTPDGARCGAPITHRTDVSDMPLCREHVAPEGLGTRRGFPSVETLRKTGLTCEVAAGQWVGLHRQTKAKVHHGQ